MFVFVFADDPISTQALNVGVWVLCAFVVINGVGIGLRMILDWRKMIALPAPVPLADQFVTHNEIQALETRLTQKLSDQDTRLNSYQEQTRERLHKLSDEINAVKLLQAALPGVLHKDIESLLKPLYDKIEAREPALAAMGVKLDILAAALLPVKMKNDL